MSQDVIEKELVDLDRLSEWMDQEGLPPGPMENVRLLTGGTQNILLQFSRGGLDCVLRRGPRHLRTNSNDIMMREARVLEALAGTDVPHPRFIARCDDEDVIGAFFFLMAPVDGFNPSVRVPPSHRENAAWGRRMGFSHCEAILALGALDYRALGLDGFGKPDHYLERQVNRWRSQLEGYAQYAAWPGVAEIPHVETIGRWLEENCPEAFTPGIIHGDCHLANVLFQNDGPELAALVDWEMATIGDPLLDIGWLMATWPDRKTGYGISRGWKHIAPIDDIVRHYVERTARDTSALNWYAVLACYKLGIVLEGTHARASAGKAPKPVGDQLHAMTVALFTHAMQWVE